MNEWIGRFLGALLIFDFGRANREGTYRPWHYRQIPQAVSLFDRFEDDVQEKDRSPSHKRFLAVIANIISNMVLIECFWA